MDIPAGFVASGTDLPPEIDDASIFLLSGRMKWLEGKGWETPGGVYTPHVPVKEEAILAEQLGFSRAWLSERYNVKEAGAILGAAGACTQRIGLGTGAAACGARVPILNASFAGTLNATFGPRFTLGLGRGPHELYQGHGFMMDGEVSYEHLLDHARIVRRLWNGDMVDYDGPAGRYDKLLMIDRPPIAPRLWFVSMGGPKASRIAADPVWDGHLLPDMFNYGATQQSVEWTRAECERIGRDFSTLRICQCVITAPECDDKETRELSHARVAIALQYVGVGDQLTRMNDWDPAVMEAVRRHVQTEQGEHPELLMEHNFHRSGMLEVAELIPDEYMHHASAIGSIDECVSTLRKFKDTGIDEIAFYGSTPAQNEKLIAAWANRDRA